MADHDAVIRRGRAAGLLIGAAAAPSALGSSSGGSSSSYCTISFNANGGKGAMADQKLKVKQNYFPRVRKNTFTRPGYVFKGWYWAHHPNIHYPNQTKADVYDLYTAGFRTVPLVARWKKKK